MVIAPDTIEMYYDENEKMLNGHILKRIAAFWFIFGWIAPPVVVTIILKALGYC